MGEILSDKEKEYLKAVIKPFREKVEIIYKGNVYFENSTEEYIGICFKNEETILPHFKKAQCIHVWKLIKNTVWKI